MLRPAVPLKAKLRRIGSLSAVAREDGLLVVDEVLALPNCAVSSGSSETASTVPDSRAPVEPSLSVTILDPPSEDGDIGIFFAVEDDSDAEEGAGFWSPEDSKLDVVEAVTGRVFPSA